VDLLDQRHGRKKGQKLSGTETTQDTFNRSVVGTAIGSTSLDWPITVKK
jgi:hypothetical protein